MSRSDGDDVPISGVRYLHPSIIPVSESATCLDDITG